MRDRARIAAIAAAAVLLTVLAHAQDPGEERDRDLPHRGAMTREQVLAWWPVSEGELRSPVAEFRALARQVREGSTDIRVLRAYHRLFPRLYPFDYTPAPDQLEKALAARQALAVRETGTQIPPGTGCWYPIGPHNIHGQGA